MKVGKVRISISFKWQDAWVGVFNGTGTKYAGAVYVCLLPCLPIEIRWKGTEVKG